ncbi:cysteine--tRNA ligase [Desulfatibacillum aliphaticivorans]|uniref:cysteine--tRNA ligase n=1 Tax=Desulfatibacillum aliphaticivorans TaxID=218208 RepID=UPI000418E671|nr:cysteine--tRNA ligase [Desulfatibacillum aliphaticivorans]
MDSILDYIGNTPLVEIRRLNPNPAVRIFAKLEYFNPGGSIKDRAALSMIEEGERTGELTKDKTVLEATSGNTGIGLALVCSVKGYRLLLAMSESVSEERRKILSARGAEILLTPGRLGTDGAIEEVYRLVRENPDKYFMTDQYNNEANWKAHVQGTAPEIWEQSMHQITHMVATIGTTGTCMGLSRGLKAFNPKIRMIGVEPYFGHKIQGLKNLKESYVPEIFDKKALDEKVNVDDEEAFEMARRLAREEGLFVGMSSGAAMAIACKKAMELKSGVIVALLPDSGERYLSTSLFAVQEKSGLSLYNTATRSKESFTPIKPGKAGMYSCGPTANEPMGLGHCRRFVFADLLSRYLTYKGLDVKHIINITDMDDKTIEGSQEAGMGLEEFTQKHIDQFMEDIETLGVKPAEAYPRASKHVDDMVEIASKLAGTGFAYEKMRSLYFDISRLEGYGDLSGIDLDKIRLGATVELDDYEKDNPRDFTLFKRSRLNELKRGIFVKTEWGNVRPSWHIQCTAMSMKYLGETYDIHTASRDLVFPHHENEVAIAKALTGKPLANYWLHCDQVIVDEKDAWPEKITLQDLKDKGYTGRQIRFWLLATHYRKPLHLTLASLDSAAKGLERLDHFVEALQNADGARTNADVDQLLYDIKQGFIAAMDDDLSVSAALSSLFAVVKKVNRLASQNALGSSGANKILEALRKTDQVLGVLSFDAEPQDAEISALMEKREKARAEGDYAAADAIRDQLTARGVTVRDGKAK